MVGHLLDSGHYRESIESINDIEPDGYIGEQAARWFRSTLLNCVIAAPEANRVKMLWVRGRLFVPRDLFELSESDVIALVEEYEIGDEVAEVFEVGERRTSLC